MKKPYYSLPEKRSFAKDMRRQPTRAEEALWFHLKCSNLGYRFFRQSLQRGYILDFYCPALRIAIEVDGSVHDRPEVAALDEKKERLLTASKITVLRFENEEVLEFISVVVTRILNECKRVEGLKAVASDLSGGGAKASSSNNRGAVKEGNLSKPNGIIAAITTTESAKPCGTLVAPCELVELNRKMVSLQRRTDMRTQAYVDTRPVAEKVWEQRYKLEEWLKQHPELKKEVGKAVEQNNTAVELVVRRGLAL
jgi:very-short-patch-repair endonuclease